jgi:hypothetical protein
MNDKTRLHAGRALVACVFHYLSRLLYAVQDRGKLKNDHPLIDVRCWRDEVLKAPLMLIDRERRRSFVEVDRFLGFTK